MQLKVEYFTNEGARVYKEFQEDMYKQGECLVSKHSRETTYRHF